MGSSGGSSSFNRPSTPVPPNVANYGSTTGFQPTYVNFLGDTNVPSTGLTPDMLKQIDSGAYMKPGNPIPGGDGGGDRGLLAQIMARLEAMQKPNRMTKEDIMRRAMGRGNGSSGFSGGSGGGGYTTSGRSGAGSFGSRSSSASRAGGGLY